MAENELILAPDTERIYHGDSTATAEAIDTLALRLAAVENELRLAKTKGLAANIPPEGFKATASNTATVGTYDIYHPRTGKISARIGPLGSVNSDKGPYIDSEGGIILGGESAYGSGFFDQYYGHWYLVPGHENYGASNDADSLFFAHKQGTIDSSTSVDAVIQIRHDNALAPYEEYALCPTRSPSGFGAARPGVSLGSNAHADYAWDRIVGKAYYLNGGGSFIDDSSIDGTDGTSGLAHYVTYTYNSGHFTGNGAMTWGVDNADELIRYSQFGKQMHVMGSIQQTDVAGTPNTDLQLTIPGGRTNGSAYAWGSMSYGDAGGALTVGHCFATPSATVITFRKADSSNWTATSGDNTYVYFSIWLEFA